MLPVHQRHGPATLSNGGMGAPAHAMRYPGMRGGRRRMLLNVAKGALIVCVLLPLWFLASDRIGFGSSVWSPTAPNAAATGKSGNRKVLEDSVPTYPNAQLLNLVLVAGHAVYTGLDFSLVRGGVPCMRLAAPRLGPDFPSTRTPSAGHLGVFLVLGRVSESARWEVGVPAAPLPLQQQLVETSHWQQGHVGTTTCTCALAITEDPGDSRLTRCANVKPSSRLRVALAQLSGPSTTCPQLLQTLSEPDLNALLDLPLPVPRRGAIFP